MKNISSHYEKLAFEQSFENSGDFLSGWQSVNPFLVETISTIRERASKMNYQRYLYYDEDDTLINQILQMHYTLDGVMPENALCGSGSTTLIFAFLSYLKQIGTKKIYCIPPIYFTIYEALERYGIELIQVSDLQPFEHGFFLNLPKESNSVLLLSDPIWYTGTSISKEIIAEIKKWQCQTSSFVFVDGSLQYLSWYSEISESTSVLDPKFTFRLLCPTKQLAANGFRFSYMLIPNSEYRKLAWIYSNIYGSASVESMAFAYEAIPVLVKRNISNLLIEFVKNRYLRMAKEHVIETSIEPNCGYFMFGKINKKIPEDQSVVNGIFFNQENFPEYSKINLLSPSFSIIEK